MTGRLYDYINTLKTKRVAVVGAGVSNMPLIGLLLDAGIEITICDRRTRGEIGETVLNFEKSGVKLRLGDGYLDDLTEDVIFRTPGLMPANPGLKKAVANGAVLTSEMEVFFDICPCTTIGVTGSDGKTTTTTIIGELLKRGGKTTHVGGNIGTPLLSKVNSMSPDDIAVIELSSFQLITMEKSPNIAVVTNISPNHLDIHTDMNEYITAKENIFSYQTVDDRVVFNYDNDITRGFAITAHAEDVLFFSRSEEVENGIYQQNDIIYENIKGKKTAIIRAEEILLPGIHNVENYMAAFAAVAGLVDHDILREVAKSFRGVEHRIELVREQRGVRYYNDSIASSPSRAIAGIRALSANCDKKETGKRKIILIAGGKDKGIAFDDFGAEIVAKVKELVLTGAAAPLIKKAVENSEGFDKTCSFGIRQIHYFPGFEDAVLMASKLAGEGDIVLLSPACTSFDMFNNFEERGNKFKEIINGLV